MLEWYRANANYHQLITDCQNLLTHLASSLETHHPFASRPGLLTCLSRPMEILTIEDAFVRFAGWNPLKECDERRFEEDLVLKVEPSLPGDRAVILKDFPWWAASLAKLDDKDPSVCQRLELYMCGVELANGFSELLDSREQRKRFEIENQKRGQYGLDPIPIPEGFLQALDNCPPSAGIALGIDRLLMILIGASTIQELLPTPFSED